MTEKENAVKLPSLRWDLNVYNLAMVIVAATTFYVVTQSKLDAADERARKYTPIIEELTRKDIVQDSRIEYTSTSLRELRNVTNEQIIAQGKTNAEVLAQLSAIRETLAWFRAAVESDSPPRRPRQRTLQ